MRWPRVLITSASIFAACASLRAGEASGGPGGTGSGSNETTLTIERSKSGLPWPEPDAKATEKLTAELKADLPDFFITRIGPWIVATDMEKSEAPRFTEYTIAKYAADIQRQLFTATPRTEPVKVLLFKDKLSYETWNKTLYGTKPTTPYGYYSRQHKALVMNIATGGGTLLHEMVHAMAEADFGEIPAWLNEGLGSLYEASSRGRGNRVIGITNWRLNGLLDSLKAGTATKFKDLIGMSDEKFYGERSGQNYASARYLMQYLQQNGKLETFYARVRDKKDADAQTSLRAVFDNKLSIEELETACYAWVKTLVTQ